MEILYLVLGAFIYAFGIQHGKAFAENKKVNIVPNPARSLKQYQENKKATKQEDLANEAINNLMSYTGDKQQKVGG